MTTSSIIKITTECNNNCVFCHSEPKKSIDGGSDINTFKKVHQLKEKGVKAIFLSGGDPFLNPKILTLIKYIKKQGLDFGLITNCRYLANKKNFDVLKDLGLKYVHTTLLGPTARVHDAITRTPQSFDQAVEGMKHVINAGIPLEINYVVIKHNLDHMKETADFLESIHAPHIRFSFVEPLDISNKYIPRVRDVASRVTELITTNTRSIQIKFDNMPMCLTRDIEEHRQNLMIENIMFMSEYYEDFIYPSDAGNKIKTERCNGCTLRTQCEGLYKKYIEIYSDDELISQSI